MITETVFYYWLFYATNDEKQSVEDDYDTILAIDFGRDTGEVSTCFGGVAIEKEVCRAVISTNWTKLLMLLII